MEKVGHKIMIFLGGTNKHANRWLLRSVCNAPKTKQDVRQIRKADRQSDRNSEAIKPKGKIQSALFAKSAKQPKIDKSKLPELPSRMVFG